MEEKIKAGWWANKAPVGYENIKNPRPTSPYDKRIIQPVESQADLIMRLFNDYSTSRYNLQDIVKKYNYLGLTNNQGRPLQVSVVHRLLRNPVYYGDIIWNGKTYPGKHQPIVSKEIWSRVQAVLSDHNQHASRTRKHDYLLRGYLYCSDCDSRFWAAPHKGNTTIVEYYFCSSCKKGTYTKVVDLEKQVEKWFGKVQMSDNYANDLIQAAKEVVAEIRKEKSQDQKDLVNKRTAIQTKLQRVEDKLIDGVISDDQFQRISTRLEEQLTQISQAVDSTQYTYSNRFETIKELVGLARDIKGTYQKADKYMKRNYIKLFFSKFVVENGQIVEAIPSKDLAPLIQNGKITVQVRTKWLPLVDAFRNRQIKITVPIHQIETIYTDLMGNVSYSFS